MLFILAKKFVNGLSFNTPIRHLFGSQQKASL